MTKPSTQDRSRGGFPDRYTQRLGKRFDFTPGDLLANQQGRLSERQLQMYGESGTRWPRNAAIGGVIFGLLWGVRAMTFNAPPYNYLDGIVMALGCFLSIYLPVLWLRWFLFRRATRDGSCKSVTGQLKFFTISRRGPVTGIQAGPFGLKGRNFWRLPEDSDLLDQGRTYTLYYRQGVGTTKVLSIQRGSSPGQVA